MATFRTLSADDVRAILDGYEALGAASYRAHEAIAGGAINTNVRVETTEGPRFLRVNEGKTRDDVEREVPDDRRGRHAAMLDERPQRVVTLPSVRPARSSATRDERAVT